MQKLLRVIAAFGVFILVTAIGYVFVVQPDADEPVGVNNLERTILVQFRDAAKFGELSFVVADQGKKWIYIPSNLVFTAEPAIITLGSSTQDFFLRNSLNRLNDSVGLEIDDIWQIDDVAFASLVEAADGVEILKPKQKTLNGFEALSFVFEQTNNPKIILQRFKKIWRQIIESFGSDEMVNVLTTIGSSSRSTIEQEEFAGFLALINQHRKDVIFRKTELNSDFRLTFESRSRLIDAGVRERLAP